VRSRRYTAFDIIAIGTSLGGREALSTILSTLPANFPAAIVIVQHLSTKSEADRVPLLQRETLLPVQWATVEDKPRPGKVYAAPPGKHLIVNSEQGFEFSDTRKVNFVRPSIDVLFTSVAVTYRKRAIGVILTGRLFDGAEGMRAIKMAGGRTLVQDEISSRAFSMPDAAIRTGAIDFVLPLEKIAAALVTLVMVQGATSVLAGQMPFYSAAS